MDQAATLGWIGATLGVLEDKGKGSLMLSRMPTEQITVYEASITIFIRYFG
jgi:hypothetical protein